MKIFDKNEQFLNTNSNNTNTTKFIIDNQASLRGTIMPEEMCHQNFNSINGDGFNQTPTLGRSKLEFVAEETDESRDDSQTENDTI